MRIGYEFTYLYLSLCPFTGEVFAAFLPALNGPHLGWFIDRMRQALGQPTLLIADGATAHQAALFEEGTLRLVKLPPACPELNPVERFFKAVRQRLKNRVFVCLEQAQAGRSFNYVRAFANLRFAPVGDRQSPRRR